MKLFYLLLFVVLMLGNSGPITAIECEGSIHAYCAVYCMGLMMFGGPLWTPACIITCTVPLHSGCGAALFLPTP